MKGLIQGDTRSLDYRPYGDYIGIVYGVYPISPAKTQ